MNNINLKEISVYDFLKLTKSLWILDKFYYWSWKTTIKNKDFSKIKKIIKETEGNYDEASDTNDLFYNILGDEVCNKVLKSV